MSDGVTVRLTEDGPIRYNGGGIMVERGETVTTNADHAAYLVDNQAFEWVECDCSNPGDCEVPGCEAEPAAKPTCAGNGGECSREVDEAGGYCWQHGED